MAKNARDPVQFTYESAERIASVVRAAETTPPTFSPLAFQRRIMSQSVKAVRLARYSGSWPQGTTKVVTFQETPAGTATVTNYLYDIIADDALLSQRYCLVAREGQNWWLVAPQMHNTPVTYLYDVTAAFDSESCAVTLTKYTATQNVLTYNPA